MHKNLKIFKIESYIYGLSSIFILIINIALFLMGTEKFFIILGISGLAS